MSDILSSISLLLAIAGLFISQWYVEAQAIISAYEKGSTPKNEPAKTQYYEKTILIIRKWNYMSIFLLLVVIILIPRFIRVCAINPFNNIMLFGMKSIYNFDDLQFLFLLVFVSILLLLILSYKTKRDISKYL